MYQVDSIKLPVGVYLTLYLSPDIHLQILQTDLHTFL